MQKRRKRQTLEAVPYHTKLYRDEHDCLTFLSGARKGKEVQ